MDLRDGVLVFVMWLVLLSPIPDSGRRDCFEAGVGRLLSRGAARAGAPAAARRALRVALAALWPGVNVELFGSQSTGLGAPNSDVDLAVTLPPGVTAEQAARAAASLLRAAPAYYRRIHARTRLPALTFLYVPAQITCDLHFRLQPTETVESSLLRHLLHTNQQTLNFAIIVKHWAKLHKLVRPKYLTSYGMMMLVVFYLQQRNVLPSVELLQRNVPTLLEPTTGFNMAFEKWKYISDNNETLYEMLRGFFEYYENFDFEEFVVSPFVGEPVRKIVFRNMDILPHEFLLYKDNVANNISAPLNVTALCIQSLLVLNDNCAWRIPDAAIFQQHFKMAAKSYRDKDKCSFLEVLGISI